MNANLRVTKPMTQRIRYLGLFTIVVGVFFSYPDYAAADSIMGLEEGQTRVTAEDYLCPDNRETHYIMSLNGATFDVYFNSAASGIRSYVQDRYHGKYYIRFGSTPGQLVNPTPRNQQDKVDGRTGPGYIGVKWDYRHRLVFWVDFKNTPDNGSDDQRFDGYIMTQTERAFAGITWANGIPLPFNAGFHHCI